MTEEQTKLVKAIKDECLANYEAGGDVIIECFTDAEILAEFASVDDAREYCGLRAEMATNARWGEDGDPEVNRPEWK